MKWLCLFAALAAFFVTNLHAREAWVTLTDCQYVANDSNDGDSFHVRAGDKEYVFRLYFVDAPEIDSINPARLVEQAKYFGLTVPEVIELGRAANAYAHERLAEPFSVTTRFAHSMARGKAERFLAFVQTKEGDLGEQLVGNGLARIFGTSATRPETASSTVEAEKLARLENQAKGKHLGGWGGKEQFKESPAPSASATNAASTKIDVNNATRKELETIPGIGPVMAQRIIDARPFQSANDLQRVDGIGKKKYEIIRPFFD